ncbi:MAG: hypothetical protein EBS01_03170, partial [Verrucomicrobia bacterium]|nr:hypothetical protein [Verrucomicrobiota bacterium]
MRTTTIAIATALGIATSAARAEVTLTDSPDKVRVEVDGKLLTEYCYRGASHVYFYPLIGPGGARMTRSFPMEALPGEEHDHPHHRSLWFAHGNVNGIDFWAETASFKSGAPKSPLGQIVHDEFLEKRGGKDMAVIRDRLKWLAPDGSVPLTSEQTFRVHQPHDSIQELDFEVTLIAGAQEVVLGDTKEGAMALRINESMRLALPGKQPGSGRIHSSTGKTDAEVWGTRAEWVDMSGPVNGTTVGIALLDHPQNPRHPTRWHARDYGLFAANPFCEHDMNKAAPAGTGDLKLAPGQRITFRYRIILHPGDAAA